MQTFLVPLLYPGTPEWHSPRGWSWYRKYLRLNQPAVYETRLFEYRVRRMYSAFRRA